MIRKQRQPIWPYLCVLACLFVLAIVSPHSWDRKVAYRTKISDHPSPATDTDYKTPLESVVPAIRTSIEPHETELEPIETVFVAPNDVSFVDPIWISPTPKQESQFEDQTIPVKQEDVDCLSEPILEPISEPILEPQPESLPVPDEKSKWKPEWTSGEQTVIDGYFPSGKPAGHSGGFPTVSVRVPLAEKSMISDASTPDMRGWVVPESLLEQLDQLAWDCDLGPWAMKMARMVRRFCHVASHDTHEAKEIAKTMVEPIAEANRMADALGADPRAVELRRVRHALIRRLDIWYLALSLQDPKTSDRVSSTDLDRLAQCMERVERVTNRSQAGRAWRKYLQWDLLKRLVHSPEIPPQQRRQITRECWERMVRTPMTSEQRAYISEEPFAELISELQRLAGEPVVSTELVQFIENFEKGGHASDARLVADTATRLGISASNRHRSLALHLAMHYRNANVRITVSESLLDRLMPKREPEYRWVNDRVAGAATQGQRVTDTDVRMQLIPDSKRLRMALAINGQVSALTTSTSGPATFTNDSQLTYRAWKEIDLTMSGLRLSPARVFVENDLQLRSLQTDYDNIPLIGFWVKEVARAEHAEKRPTVNLDMKRMATCRAKKQIDSEAGQRLRKLDQALVERMLEPLASMGISPTLVDGQTTKQQMTMRVRLADEMQLGSHTPRPRSPDGLFSVQLHESVLNNIFEKLELDGKSFTPTELHQHLAKRLHRPEMLGTSSEHEDVTIAFPPRDALHVSCRDGQVIVTLSIMKLSRASRAWQKFQVRAHYRPRVQSRTMELIRQESVELVGPMKLKSRIALLGIFNKVFSQQQPIPVTPRWLQDDPRLDDLEISQLIIDEGWISIALNVTRSEPRPLVARRQKLNERARSY